MFIVSDVYLRAVCCSCINITMVALCDSGIIMTTDWQLACLGTINNQKCPESTYHAGILHLQLLSKTANYVNSEGNF